MTERERDERDLYILELFEAGYTQPQIGRIVGLSRNGVAGVIGRIRRDMIEDAA